MDRIDQFPALTLAGDDKIAAQVDYQTCERCRFRLMRVETTIIGAQRLVASRCPICEQHAGKLGGAMLPAERLRYFDAWLSIHNLDQDLLKQHYHLDAVHFFDDEE